MRRLIPLYIIFVFFLCSCTQGKLAAKSEDDIIEFLSRYSIVVDRSRPKYSSTVFVPKIFDTIWEMREVLSKDVLGISLKKFRGKECSIYMYPLIKTPFKSKNSEDSESRGVVICCDGSIICSYIENISTLRKEAPMSLEGKSIEELSGVKWNQWREGIESDDNKRLVIWQYYNALRAGNYEGAYWYIYNKEDIKKEDFVKTATQVALPYIDFVDIEQYKKPTDDECYFIVKARVQGESKNNKDLYEITFDLKKDKKEEQYGGWKILRTKIK